MIKIHYILFTVFQRNNANPFISDVCSANFVGIRTQKILDILDYKCNL